MIRMDSSSPKSKQERYGSRGSGSVGRGGEGRREEETCELNFKLYLHRPRPSCTRSHPDVFRNEEKRTGSAERMKKRAGGRTGLTGPKQPKEETVEGEEEGIPR